MLRDYKLHRLTAEFFQRFSRLEYALKASGFHHGDGDAKANWARFATEVDILILNPDSKELNVAIDFIFSNPPKKQVVRNGKLEWIEASPTQALKADNLLIYVRRVRNNLFHGGKFNGRWFAPERSEELMRHSLVILSSCEGFVSSVNDAYNG